jgi:hypothetical protein
MQLAEGGEKATIGSVRQGLDITRRVIAATCMNGLGHEHVTGSRASQQGICVAQSVGGLRLIETHPPLYAAFT